MTGDPIGRLEDLAEGCRRRGGVGAGTGDPGSSTPPGSWIIQSSIRAWELVQGRKHEVRKGTSGGADANVIRAAGVPTARIGLPMVEAPDDLRGFSMGVADPQGMATLTRTLCAAIVDTCTRTRAETRDAAGAGADPE